MKSLLVAGTHSGAGKTTVSLGLMAALTRRGLSVAPFKIGPDFIDPGHHARICGVPGRNLDGWMMPPEENRRIFHRAAARGADVAVVEGVMGLFDGVDGRSEDGSSSQAAKWLNAPVLLVVSARSMARSAAALVCGFENFDPDVRFAGVLFNHVGSPRHLAILREALEGHVNMPLLGALPRSAGVALPERHLGLVTAEDHPLTTDHIRRLADLTEEHIDLDALLARLPDRPPDPDFSGPISTGSLSVKPDATGPDAPSALPKDGPRIGVARDAAFCFYYPENLEFLEAAGARLIPFSPAADADLPEDLDGLYLGGGYPELAVEALSANESMRRAVLAASLAHMPIYAECGGFMYLCRSIRDLEGRQWPMTGVFPFAPRMSARLQRLGYREVRLRQSGLLGPAGTRLRGHEFHYSDLGPEDAAAAASDPEITCLYDVERRRDGNRTEEGFLVRRTLGSYLHLHFGSCPAAAGAFAGACGQFQRTMTK